MQSELLRIWQRSPKTVIFVTHDVQEAVYLANRVIVMSARPGRVKAVVEIDIDRTQPGVQKSSAFAEKVDEIWDLVRTEAILHSGSFNDRGVHTLSSAFDHCARMGGGAEARLGIAASFADARQRTFRAGQSRMER